MSAVADPHDIRSEDPELEPTRELMRALSTFAYAMTRSQTHNRMTAGTGITVERAGIAMLRVLRTHPKPLRMSELAELLLVRPPHATRQVAQLEEAGLVERARPEGDHRILLVRLTRRGRAAIDKYNQAMFRSLRSSLEGETAQDIQTAARILGKLADNARHGT